MSLQNIETDREVQIGRINEHDIVNAFRGNETQNLVNQIAVRIEDANAVTVLNVLPD